MVGNGIEGGTGNPDVIAQSAEPLSIYLASLRVAAIIMERTGEGRILARSDQYESVLFETQLRAAHQKLLKFAAAVRQSAVQAEGQDNVQVMAAKSAFFERSKGAFNTANAPLYVNIAALAIVSAAAAGQPDESLSNTVSELYRSERHLGILDSGTTNEQDEAVYPTSYVELLFVKDSLEQWCNYMRTLSAGVNPDNVSGL